jgi:endoplasmic reticulum-Golgi intermediate compartment protein 2
LPAKTKATYTTATRRGGQWTLVLLAACTFLTFSELLLWLRGVETQHFSVEKGISHLLQLNLDIVVAMRCDYLHVNVQDAAGDRILAGDLLTKHDTSWALWTDKKKKRRQYQSLNAADEGRRAQEAEDQHVGHVLGHMNEGGRKFPSTPKLRRGELADSCRIFGSLEGNKVQGDFHITARGHGYVELGEHIPHDSMFAGSDSTT